MHLFAGNWTSLIKCQTINSNGEPKPPGIIISTDGISPFKSSNLTVWPIVLALSNLPPNLRWNKDNLIISSLWVAEKKPSMNVFFAYLKDVLSYLSEHGINLVTPQGNKSLKFQPWFGSFDFVAKAPILNMHQFNGEYGCPSCLHPGIHTSSRYYLPGTEYPLRTNDSILEDAEEAERSGKCINGIKGKSVLTGVFDLVKGVPVDYMHCVLEGVTKWMLNKWVSSSNHNCAYYVGRDVSKMDSQLLDQRPPHDFSRAPRSIARHRKHWKASEYRNWLLYYSLPLLVSVNMSPLYLHHHALLVCSIHILLQPKLTEAQIKAAEEMLKDYYAFLPDLYGTASCTLNAHSLSHLTTYVRLWGPLWMHSLFGFESLNGHLTSMIHSKYKVAEQLSFSVNISQSIGKLASKLIETENDNTLTFISSLSSSLLQHNKMMLVLPDIYATGAIKHDPFTDEEILVLQEVTEKSAEEILTFHKLYLKETYLLSNRYAGKRSSSVCCYSQDGIKHYGVIEKFCFSPPFALIRPFQRTSSSLLKVSGNPCREKLRGYAQADLLSLFFIEVRKKPLPLCAISISNLLSKCVKVNPKHLKQSYIIPIPNNFERH